MKKFFQKQREVIAMLAYAGVLVGSVYLAILPLLERIHDVNDQIQEENMKQEFAGKQLGEIPKFQRQYAALEKDADLLDILLDKTRAVVLIEGLEKIAQDSDNNIAISVQQNALPQRSATSAVKTAVNDTLIGALPSQDYLQMTIKLEGAYNAVMDFIEVLENSEYYSDIVAIQIGQVKTDGKSSAASGTSNPFVSNPKNKAKISDNANPGNLEASLDVVFYTKK